MFKKSKLLLCLLICLSQTLTACSIISENRPHSKQTLREFYGTHKVLLDPQLSKEEKLAYCEKKDINQETMQQCIIEYDGFINGYDEVFIELPVFDPSVYKNILSVTFNYPVIVQKNDLGKGFKYLIDPRQFKTTNGRLAEVKLIVSYLMNTENYEYMEIPENHLAQSIDMIKRNNGESKYSGTSIETLAFQLRENMSKETQDSVREIVKCYRKWIKENIWYPDLNYKEVLIDMNYIHVNNPLRTLELKVGVCADDAKLLQALLETQGIVSEYIIGFNSSSMSEDRSHAVLGVVLDSGTYMVDPTVYKAGETKEIEISKNLLVSFNRETSEKSLYDDGKETFAQPLVPLSKETSIYENPSFNTNEFTFKKVYIENFNFKSPQ